MTGALTARGARNMGQSNDDVDGHKIISMAHGQGGAEVGFDRSPTLTCNHEAPIAAYPATAHTLLGKPNCSHAADKETYVVHPLRGEGFDASEDGTGRGTPLVPVAFSCKDYGADAGEVAPTLRSMGHDKSHANAGGQVAIAFNARQDPDHWHDRTGPLDTDGSTQAVSYAIQAGALRTNPNSGPDGVGVQADHAYTLEARAEVQAVAFQERGRKDGRSLEVGDDVAYALTAPNGGGRAQERNVLTPTMQVRRLTPTECARLQGFPDDYLDITYRNKPAADGPKYKALGNSWAVPCVTWIGQRIAASLE